MQTGRASATLPGRGCPRREPLAARRDRLTLQSQATTSIRHARAFLRVRLVPGVLPALLTVTAPLTTALATQAGAQTGVWTPASSLVATRHSHTATLLTSGKVLLAGGNGASGARLNSAELYDPVTGTWEVTLPLAPVGGTYTAEVTDSETTYTALLSNPDLTEVTMNTSLPRTVESVNQTSLVQPDVDIVFEGSALGNLLTLVSGLAEDTLTTQFLDFFLDPLEEEIRRIALATPAPVTVIVTVTP